MGSELSKLSADQRAAAALDAADFSGDRISRVLGVGLRTVARWRQNPEYQLLVTELGERAEQDMAPIVSSIKVEAVGYLQRALKTLDDNLEAVTRDGRPAYKTRTTAAAALATKTASMVPGVIERAGDDGESGSKSGGTAVIVVQQNRIDDVKRSVRPVEDGQDVIDVTPVDDDEDS